MHDFFANVFTFLHLYVVYFDKESLGVGKKVFQPATSYFEQKEQNYFCYGPFATNTQQFILNQFILGQFILEKFILRQFILRDSLSSNQFILKPVYPETVYPQRQFILKTV